LFAKVQTGLGNTRKSSGWLNDLKADEAAQADFGSQKEN
jgi:hypothetical protein